MRKFFSFMCALAIVLSASAAPMQKIAPLQKTLSNQPIKVEKVAKPVKLAKAAKAPQAKAATPLASGTFYTVGGNFYAYGSSGWIDATSEMPSVEVTVDGDQVTIVGLAYYFQETGAITGTLEGNVITFPNGQLIGTDEYGDEFLVGSDDGETVAESIIFTYDPEAQTLTANTPYIFENSKTDAISCYCYWYNAVFGATEPEGPELVVLPVGAEVVEYKMDYKDGNGEAAAKVINVAVVGDEVYFQGMSEFIPESWVVGTKDGNVITFAADQYVGEYSTYGSSYFFYADAVEFVYEPENDIYSAEGQVFGVLGGRYYDGNYFDPVLSKAKEPDFEHPIEIVITNATHKFDSQYSDITYQLSNATADTVLVVDIKLASGEDVESGTTYTLADMYGGEYTYMTIAGENVNMKSVEFVKTVIDANTAHIEATVVDMDVNVFHFAGTVVEETIAPVEIPTGLETVAYKFDGHNTYSDEQVVKFVQVGFDGDDLYIQGMSDFLPEAWIKGTKASEGVFEFPETFLGTYSSIFGDYDMYSSAFSMTYDAEKDQFACAAFTTTADGEVSDEYEDITLTLFTEVAATPADPVITNFVFANVSFPKVEFEISTLGTNGEELLPGKLSYIFFTQKGNEEAPLVLTTDLYTKLDADMTEIPYTFSDNWDIYSNKLYLNQSEEEARSWDKLGLQVIYRGGDEEHKSNIVWFDVKAYWAEVDGATGIENVELTEQAQKVAVDGQLFIIRDNKMFNAIGTRIR